MFVTASPETVEIPRRACPGREAVPLNHGRAPKREGDSSIATVIGPIEGSGLRMDHWIQETRQILERSPTGALPFSEIRAELKRAGIHLGGRDRWLLTALENRGDLFRIVPCPGGPWSYRPSPLTSPPIPEDPWIVLQVNSATEAGMGGQILACIREAVQAWGRRLDDGSPSGVARWIRANREGARSCRALVSRRLRDT